MTHGIPEKMATPLYEMSQVPIVLPSGPHAQSAQHVLAALGSNPQGLTRAEAQARLFEPFVTSKPEGVGLGLAVARQIVEAHGGSIRWERRDEATCFRIEVPLGHVESPLTERRADRSQA